MGAGALPDPSQRVPVGEAEPDDLAVFDLHAVHGRIQCRGGTDTE